MVETGQGRSKATSIPGDVSPAGERASAAPANPFRGYRPDRRWKGGRRVEPCACGASLVLYLGENVQEVVEAHNLGRAHQGWRGRRP